jgi:flagellar basal-body rod protein FlgB
MVDPIFQTDTYQLAQKLLDASALRQEAIASNFANAETPGYHRIDLSNDFASHLKAAVESGAPPAEWQSIQPTLSEDTQARAVRPDGNNVDMDSELLAMDKNSVEYNYLANVVTQNLKDLKTAITGNA